MQYSEFKPTVFDSHITIEDREEWLVVPVSITRDTEDAITLSNWQTIENELNTKFGEEGEKWEIHRFGHWGPGWVEIIIVHPDLEEWLYDLESALADYPVLDDEHHSEKEHELAQGAWESWQRREVARGLVDYDSYPQIYNLIECCPEQIFDEWFFDHCRSTSEYYRHGNAADGFEWSQPTTTELMVLISTIRKAIEWTS